MAIRIRNLDSVIVALCAAETDAEPGDIYLDDEQHYALAAKFARDWQGQTVNFTYPATWRCMDTQKVRDAKTELNRWLAEREVTETWETVTNIEDGD